MMSIPLLIFGFAGVAVIFAVAAWAGPKMIRAFYPEAQHERMIKMHRMMVIIAIVVGVLGFVSALVPLLMNQ